MTTTTLAPDSLRIGAALDEIQSLYLNRIDREAHLLLGFLSQTVKQEPDPILYIDGQIGWQLSLFLQELVAIAGRHDLHLEVVLNMAARVAEHRHSVWAKARLAAAA
jgi:hypothetical protein